MKKKLLGILAILLTFQITILSQYKVPDYVQNYDSDKTTVYSDDIGGGYHNVADSAAKADLPSDKRAVGMMVSYVKSGARITERYDYTDVLTVNWINEDNWTLINTDGWNADSMAVYNNDSSIIDATALTDTLDLRLDTLPLNMLHINVASSLPTGSNGDIIVTDTTLWYYDGTEWVVLNNNLFDLRYSDSIINDTSLLLSGNSDYTYSVKPNGGDISIVIPEPWSTKNDIRTTFTLIGSGQFVITTSGDTTLIGNDGTTSQIVSEAGSTITLESNIDRWKIVQDSRPKQSISSNIYYLEYDTSEVILGYSTMTQYFDSLFATRIDTTITVLASDQLIVSWTSDTGVFNGVIPESNYTINIEAYQSGGGTSANIYCEVYQRESGGTENLISTTNTSLSLIETDYETIVLQGVLTSFTGDLSDRLVVKLYSSKVGVGGDPIVSVGLEGLNPSRINLTLPTVVNISGAAGNNTEFQYNNVGILYGANNFKYYGIGDSTTLTDGSAWIRNNITVGDTGKFNDDAVIRDTTINDLIDFRVDKYKVDSNLITSTVLGDSTSVLRTVIGDTAAAIRSDVNLIVKDVTADDTTRWGDTLNPTVILNATASGAIDLDMNVSTFEISNGNLFIDRNYVLNFSDNSANDWEVVQIDAADLHFRHNSSTRFQFVNSSPSYFSVGTTVAGRPALYDVQPTSTVPAWSFIDDANTGIGRASSDILSLIAGGNEGLRIHSDTAKTDFLYPKNSTYIDLDDTIALNDIKFTIKQVHNSDSVTVTAGGNDYKWYTENESGSDNQQISFTTSIPFNYTNTGVTLHELTQNETFSINTTGAFTGAETYYEIQSNGTYTINTNVCIDIGTESFSTDADTVNVLKFEYVNSRCLLKIIDKYYVDGTAPILLTFTVEDANPDSLIIKASEHMTGTEGAGAGGFTINDTITVTNVNISNDTIGLALSDSLLYDSIYVISYSTTTGDIEDLSGNPLANFTDSSITNNVDPEILASYYVRPLGGSYGLEDGSSYDNAWDGFADIENDSLIPRTQLYVCGTHNEQLTIGVSGDSDHNVIFRGDYPSDSAVINIEGETDLYCIFMTSKDYVTIRDFDTLIGSGLGGALTITGYSGAAGDGHNVIVSDVNVIRNYASTNGDGFALYNYSEVLFYDITAAKCRTEGSLTGSHQCFTSHDSCSAKVYGGTFETSNYWIVQTQDCRGEFYDITFDSALVAGIEAGTDATEYGYVKVYNSVMNFDNGIRPFYIAATCDSNTLIYLEDTELNITSSTASVFSGGFTLNNCVLDIDDAACNFTHKDGKLDIYDCTWDLENTGAGFIYSQENSTMDWQRNTINILSNDVGYINYNNSTAIDKSLFVNNIITGVDEKTGTILLFTDDCYAPTMANNTVYASASGGYLMLLQHDGDEPGAEQLDFKNNICYNVDNVITASGGAVYNHNNNCFYLSEDLGGTGSITDDPEFTTPGSDFTLQVGSPCIDAGVDLSSIFTDNFDGDTRVDWDMGAY